MASNIKEFSLALRKDAADWAPQEVRKVHRAVALEAHRGLVLMNPVDSGRMRANWQFGADEPPVGVLDAFDKSGAATIARAAAEIEQIEPFSNTYSVNNVPYAEEIENGSSQQAPAGVLNVTFSRVKSWAARWL
jgi:hypothetical protein